MTYLDALAVFVTTDTAYDGGLSNHGPMAAEALVSMGAEQWIGPFVDDYRTRLEPPTATPEPVPGVWREWLQDGVQSIPAMPAEWGDVVLARREAMAADLVVVNHHLFFADLALRDSGTVARCGMRTYWRTRATDGTGTDPVALRKCSPLSATTSTRSANVRVTARRDETTLSGSFVTLRIRQRPMVER